MPARRGGDLRLPFGLIQLNPALSDRRRPAFQGENQIFGVQLELLQAHFLELFI